ncbi:hypothetical protein ACHAW5_006295 [Stephanodiscus triporus]|uniref:Phospholipid scramblase n=1 Tax=Stephanodiscus triporus TaxID=2934178 RepID=A0ABD3Q2E5_9STRA
MRVFDHVFRVEGDEIHVPFLNCSSNCVMHRYVLWEGGGGHLLSSLFVSLSCKKIWVSSCRAYENGIYSTPKIPCPMPGWCVCVCCEGGGGGEFVPLPYA